MDEPREVWAVETDSMGRWNIIEHHSDERSAVRNKLWFEGVSEGKHLGHSYRVRRYLPAESVREVLEAAKRAMSIRIGGRCPMCWRREEKHADDCEFAAALRLIEAALKEQEGKSVFEQERDDLRRRMMGE